MVDAPVKAVGLSRKPLQEKLNELLHEMQEQTLAMKSPTVEWNQESVQKLFNATAALHTFLLASASAIGECRRKKPYAPLKPVIDDQGNFKWCCEHDPEHCV
jgi:hypothetical protein